jgi:hypothetical protein
LSASCTPPGGEGECTATDSVESTCLDLYGQPLINETIFNRSITLYESKPWWGLHPADYITESKKIQRTHWGLDIGEYSNYKDFKGTTTFKIKNNTVDPKAWTASMLN